MSADMEQVYPRLGLFSPQKNDLSLIEITPKLSITTRIVYKKGFNPPRIESPDGAQ